MSASGSGTEDPFPCVHSVTHHICNKPNSCYRTTQIVEQIWPALSEPLIGLVTGSTPASPEIRQERPQLGHSLKQVHQNHSCLNSADRKGPNGGCCGAAPVQGHCLTIPMGEGAAGLGQGWWGQLLQILTASKSPVLAQTLDKPGGPVSAAYLLQPSPSNSMSPDSPDSQWSFGRLLSSDLPCSCLGAARQWPFQLKPLSLHALSPTIYPWLPSPCAATLAPPSHASSSLHIKDFVHRRVFMKCCYAISERTAQKTPNGK